MSKKKKYFQTIDMVLDHFHPDSMCYGGWNIRIAKSEINLDVAKSEFGAILNITSHGVSDYLFSQIKGAKFEASHTIRVLRQKVKHLEDENDRFYRGIKALLGE